MKIELPKIEPPTVRIYFNDEFVGIVNEYEFNALRIEIKEKNQEGWTVEFNGLQLEISPDGALNEWPKGLFSLFDEQIWKLVGF